MTNKRIFALDIFRGWAILLMMVYHFSYDLNYFHYISVHFGKELFWLSFRYLIVSMFLLSVGMSLKLVHSKGISWQKVKRRAYILGASSLLVTIVTYMQFPRTWVYFGILHFIFLASILALPFIHRPYLALFTAISIFVASFFGYLGFHSLFSYLVHTHNIPRRTEDFLPLFPWFGVVLLGIVLAHFGLAQKIKPDMTLSINKLTALLGKYSLLVYLVHLPVIFGIVWAVKILS